MYLLKTVQTKGLLLKCTSCCQSDCRYCRSSSACMQ